MTSASQQAKADTETVTFEWEPFAVLAYEAIVKNLIITMRPPDEKSQPVDRLLQCVGVKTEWSYWQRVWDEMFMIDMFPENKERFGIDMLAIVKMIAGSSPPVTPRAESI
jgi:hypothetical protein